MEMNIPDGLFLAVSEDMLRSVDSTHNYNHVLRNWV